MQVVDVIIMLSLAVGAFVGFNRGFLKQTIQSIGGILVVVLSFIFRGPVAAFLFQIFPSINFTGIFKGISSINVLVYEVIAFSILLVIFGIIYRIFVAIASFLERFLSSTILFAIPSKVFGAIMGAVEAYIYIFIALFILTLPIFNFNFINQSKYKDKILEGTPIVSELAQKTLNSFDSIYALRDDLAKETDRLKLDQKILKILIDNKIISAERADELFEEGKLDAR